LIFQIGESCSPPLPLAAGENARKPGFWQTKAYKSPRFHLPPAKMRENPVFGKQKLISQNPK